MCALIYQYKEIIIEENKYLYATITNHITIAMNKSLLKQRHRDTKNHGEMIDCITHRVCQEIQGVDEMVMMMLMKVLMMVLMMPLPEGVEPPGGDSGSGSPSDLCRRQPADSHFSVFDLCHPLPAICVGGPLYRKFLGQTKSVARKLRRNGPRKAERARVARPRGWARQPISFPLLSSFCLL